MLGYFDVPLTWTELARRTIRETLRDDGPGLAAQLAYYFLLSLFPALLCLIALASLFPLTDVTAHLIARLGPFVPAAALEIIRSQLLSISEQDDGGLVSLGLLGAIWSSSAAMVAIVGTMNRAYDIDESRPWWQVRLVAVALTVGLALFILVSFTLVVAGPELAEAVAGWFGLGAVFVWTWKILQWPVVFALVSTALACIYYFAPDAEQEWVWVTPGSVLATLLWLAASVGFRVYVINFGDYEASYGAIGGIILLMLWFYLSGLVIIVGAEMNAEMEHASPWGKEPGKKVPGERRRIGLAAARAYWNRLHGRGAAASKPAAAAAPESPVRPVQPEAGHGVDRMTDGDSIVGLIKSLVADIRELTREEISLVRAELREEAKQARSAVVAWAGAAAVGAIGLVLLCLALGGALADLLEWPRWAGEGLIALLLFGLAFGLMRYGRAEMAAVRALPKTRASVKENVEWMQNRSAPR